MPDLDKMKCIVCEEVKTVDEIEAHEGMCISCHASLGSHADEKTVEDGSDIVDPEIRDAVRRYVARKGYMKRYNEQERVRAKRKEYNASRAARDRYLVNKAKELGIIKDE